MSGRICSRTRSWMFAKRTCVLRLRLLASQCYILADASTNKTPQIKTIERNTPMLARILQNPMYVLVLVVIIAVAGPLYGWNLSCGISVATERATPALKWSSDSHALAGIGAF